MPCSDGATVKPTSSSAPCVGMRATPCAIATSKNACGNAACGSITPHRFLVMPFSYHVTRAGVKHQQARLWHRVGGMPHDADAPTASSSPQGRCTARPSGPLGTRASCSPRRLPGAEDACPGGVISAAHPHRGPSRYRAGSGQALTPQSSAPRRSGMPAASSGQTRPSPG
jgi:hypothetical protein